MASPLGLTFDNTTNSTKIGSYKVVKSKAVKSLFGGGQFSPFPSGINTESGSVTSIRNATDVHKDEIYDISIPSIVDYTSKYNSMKLTFADFAYLKNVGVFPNNRLIVARRFASGVGNDLTAIKSTPLATLISWVKDGDDFISVDYSEEWIEASASFEEVLNDIGKDIKASSDQGSGLGGAAAKAFNAIPLPGFMEGIQYQVMKNMGLTDAGIGNSPLGNPNLIRQAKQRKTVGKGEADSGLKASFSIKMSVEYEQKFINGVDPTLVYMDIIQNALTFGTSDSAFQFSSAFGTGTAQIIKDLISGDIGAIASAIGKFVTSLLDAIATVGKELIQALIDPPQDEENPSADSILNFIQKAFASTIGHVVSKYRIKLIGISNALTGSPSTPWHVTIGNPKKPIFSSGDMLCTDVSLSVGKNLAFNDLPSYIKIEFTLTNARPLGAQEIFNRFNTGKGRSYVRFNKSFVEAPDTIIEGSTIDNSVPPAETTRQVPDDYTVTFEDNGGTEYLDLGKPQSATQPKQGDSTQPQITNQPQTNPSLNSANNNSLPTAAVPAATTSLPAPTSSPLSSSQIRAADDETLNNRSNDILNEITNLPPGDPRLSELDDERRAIQSEQNNRIEGNLG